MAPPVADSLEFKIALKLSALDHGDLTRIVLVMDDHLGRMKGDKALMSVEAMQAHYNRLVTTRNKVQAVWKASLPPVPRKRRKKARKSRG